MKVMKIDSCTLYTKLKWWYKFDANQIIDKLLLTHFCSKRVKDNWKTFTKSTFNLVQFWKRKALIKRWDLYDELVHNK